MHFQIQKTDLMAAISIVSKGLSSRTAHPLLEGVHILCENNNLTLTCSDGFIQIETKAVVDAIQGGEIVLPGRLFFEIIRKFPDDLVILEQPDESQNAVVISCGHVKMNLQGFAPEEYPKMQPLNSNHSLKIPQNILKEMIKQTVFACATDEARPVLTGVLFEANAGKLKLVALDGYRLAMRSENANFDGDFSAILPASSLNEVMKILSDDEELISLAFSHSNVQIDMADTRVHAVLLNGEYMKYEQIFPKEQNTTLQIRRRELLNGIERASLMARESKNNLVRFNIEHDYVTISANSEVGSAEEEIPAQCRGEGLEIAFNARYMQDVLSRLEDEEVLLRFQSNITPCVVEPLQGNAYYYLVLPVRLMNR